MKRVRKMSGLHPKHQFGLYDEHGLVLGYFADLDAAFKWVGERMQAHSDKASKLIREASEQQTFYDDWDTLLHTINDMREGKTP